MTYDNLMVEIGDDFVGEITLNRPEQLNTFNTPLAAELVQALKELDGQTTVRVIILKGAGKAFCAGIDVNELAGKTAMEYKTWVEHMEKQLVTISRMSKPVIAQVQGVAAANGAGLVAAAEQTGTDLDLVFVVVSWTVLASIVLHGLTATPAATAYGRWWDRVTGTPEPMAEDMPMAEQRIRRGPSHDR